MLGLESQQNICRDFIDRNDGECVAEFRDVESGTHRDRKGLADAIAYCKENGCALVFAKLDRLARDVEFCFKVVNTGIEIHFVDMPQMNTLLLGVFASVAQYERELTSDRTKKALAVKKAQGCKLGAANSVYRETFNNKTEKEKLCMARKRGETKTTRYLESKQVQAFIKVLRKVFPDATVGEPIDWDWSGINTKDGIRQQILGMMSDFRDIDSTLFVGWDFSDLESVKLQWKLNNQITSLKRSVKKMQIFVSEK